MGPEAGRLQFVLWLILPMLPQRRLAAQLGAQQQLQSVHAAVQVPRSQHGFILPTCTSNSDSAEPTLQNARLVSRIVTSYNCVRRARSLLRLKGTHTTVALTGFGWLAVNDRASAGVYAHLPTLGPLAVD